jgi:hypothetical protein
MTDITFIAIIHCEARLGSDNLKKSDIKIIPKIVQSIKKCAEFKTDARACYSS